MKKIIVVAIAAQLLAGCSYSLKMKADLSPRDESISSFHLSTKKYNKLMIIPPQGTVRGAYDVQVALLERGLLKTGTTVVTAAVTARVAVDADKSNDKCCDARAMVASLSDVERALVMAKESGADAILQIGSFEWSAGNDLPGRYFIRNNSDSYGEVAQKKYLDHAGPKIHFNSDRLVFIGRLIDVQTGEVMVSFNLTCYTNWTLPGEYSATINEGLGRSAVKQENYAYYGGHFWYDSKRRTEEKVVQEIVLVIGRGKAQ